MERLREINVRPISAREILVGDMAVFDSSKTLIRYRQIVIIACSSEARIDNGHTHWFITCVLGYAIIEEGM